MKDPILARTVPFVVFVKNSQLYNEAVAAGFDGSDEQAKTELKKRAKEQEKQHKERVQMQITSPVTESIVEEYCEKSTISSVMLSEVYSCSSEEQLYYDREHEKLMDKL